MTRHACLVLLVSGVLLGTNIGVAGASTNPGPVNTTYNFSANLYGSTHFTVYGGSGVRFEMKGTYGPSEIVDITVEVQTCGFLGCHWNGATVGGTCTRTLFVGGDAVCNFSGAPNSNELHRIDMSKRTDGFTIKGNATIS